jgi:hypothetical protein
MLNVINLFAATVAFFTGFIGTRTEKTSNDMKAAQLMLVLPLPVAENMVVHDTSTIRFYEWGDKILYEFPVVRNESKLIKNEYGETTDTLISIPPSSRFFYYLKGRDTGVFWDSLVAPHTWTANVDSILKMTMLTNISEFIEAQYKETKLIYQKSVSELQQRQAFISNGPLDLGLDTMFLTFDRKPKDFHFTFSKKLDSLNQAKLVRIDFLAKWLGDEKTGIIRVPARITFDFSEIVPENKNEILDIVKKMDSLLPAAPAKK